VGAKSKSVPEPGIRTNSALGYLHLWRGKKRYTEGKTNAKEEKTKNEKGSGSRTLSGGKKVQ